MKRKIATLAGIVLMTISIICGAMDIHAMTQAEADDACGKLPSAHYSVQGTTIKCYMDQPASTQCKSVGGTFTGSSGSEYVCLIPFSKTETSGSSPENNSNNNNDGSNSGGSPSSGSESGSPGSSSDSSDGSYSTGVKGNSDNSSAKGSSKCGDGQVYTNLFGGCISADSNSVFVVLNVILQVLTWGIGIAGTLGIVITGIQYMTARDDANQMAKAKNRLIQIVIGLAIYAVMWAFLQWLLPGGVFGN